MPTRPTASPALPRGRALRLGGALAAALAIAAPLRADDDVTLLREGELAARLEVAARLRSRDLRRLGEALAALPGGKGATSGNVAFLVAFTLGERGRALRVLAVEAAGRCDRSAAGDAFVAALASETDARRAERAAEALGWLGVSGAADGLLDAVRGRPACVAVTALEALARTASKHDAPRVAAAALAHGADAVTLHGAWAVLDLAGSAKAAIGAFREAAEGEAAPRAARAEDAIAALSEQALRPHRWKTDLAAARKRLLKAPPLPRVGSGNPQNVDWMTAGLRWLGTQAPEDLWLVCAAVQRIESGAVDDTRVDLDEGVIIYDWDDAGLSEPRFAVLTARVAAVIWRRAMGEPSMGRRGWEQPVTDGWDLCAAARLFGAADEGATREDYVRKLLGFRPWELR